MAFLTTATSNAFKYLLLVTLFAVVVMVSGFQFHVGEHGEWNKPNGREAETYNEWAAKNRFRIGDSVYFKYQNDSVLVVTPAAYLNCNVTNPISKYDDGNTVFQFDRSGFFYFISGESDHCKSGQKLIIRVMHPSEIEGLAPASAPAAGGDTGSQWGPPKASSSAKIFADSYLMTALVALLVVLYLLA